MATNPQAEELNEQVLDSSPVIMELLSEKGKSIFFPKKGILGQSAEAKGKKINATIGIALEEDGTPMRLATLSKMIELDPKDAFPYAPSFGKPELRDVWKKMIFKKNPSLAGKEISLPVVTNALTHGLSMLGYLFVNPGDKIIIPDLYWGNYNLIFKNAYGAKFNTFRTFHEGRFDVTCFRNKVKEEGGKQIILLNFPNNPAGYTPTDEEAAEIVSIIKDSAESGNKILVICDDAYFGLVYRSGVYKESLFSELADLHENVLAVKLDGATKEDYVWGFRVGFVTYGIKNGAGSYAALEAKTAGAVRGNISNASHLGQSLVLKAFTSSTYDKEKKEKYDILSKRCNEVVRVLSEHSEYKEYFEAYPFNSGYFMCVKLASGLSGEKVRKVLLEKYSTGVIAMGDVIRVAFSGCKTVDIPELFSNLYKACKDCS